MTEFSTLDTPSLSLLDVTQPGLEKDFLVLGFPRFDVAQTMTNSPSLAHQKRSCSSLQYKCSQARMFGLQIKSTVLQCHVVLYSAPLCVVN